jgi:hypothetical protein
MLASPDRTSLLEKVLADVDRLDTQDRLKVMAQLPKHENYDDFTQRG